MKISKGHTTRRYRGRGEDLLMGVGLNVITALLTAVFHFMHARMVDLPRFFLRDFPDVCIPLGLLISWLVITIYSLRKAPKALSPFEPIEPSRASDIWFSYGFVFNLQMLLIALGLTWWAYGKSGRPWFNGIQPILAVSFWITTLTYLPVLGLFRSGGFKRYWQRHRHLFVLPVSVGVHSTVFYQMTSRGLDWVMPNSQVPIERQADLTAIGFSAILGFFSALIVYKLYERILFGKPAS